MLGRMVAGMATVAASSLSRRSAISGSHGIREWKGGQQARTPSLRCDRLTLDFSLHVPCDSPCRELRTPTAHEPGFARFRRRHCSQQCMSVRPSTRSSCPELM